MRFGRRIALLLGPQRVRFLGMTVAGVLLIALTATTEGGAAARGLAYVMRAGQPSAVGPVGGPPAASDVASPLPSPTPAPSAAPAANAAPSAGQLPVPPTSTPSPVAVTPAPSSPPAPTPTNPPAATTPPPTTSPRGGTVAPPAATPWPATPTPAPSPLALRVDTGATSYLFQVSAIVPGDTWTRDATVTNTGSVGFRYVFEFTQSTSSLLWTDPDGLFVHVTSGSAVLYDGQASAAGPISAPNTVAPGASDALRFVFSLPVSADDRLQGLAQDLQIVFTATQTP